MIDVRIEKVIILAAAALLVPRRRAGRKCSVSTVYRWTSTGCRGIVLESIQIGATRCTSEEALARFFQKLTSGNTVESTPVVSPSMTARLQNQKRIDAELDRLGLA